MQVLGNRFPLLKSLILRRLRGPIWHFLRSADTCTWQPKLPFLPEGQRGGTKFLEVIRGRGERPRESVAKVTSETEPVS